MTLFQRAVFQEIWKQARIFCQVWALFSSELLQTLHKYFQILRDLGSCWVTKCMGYHWYTYDTPLKNRFLKHFGSFKLSLPPEDDLIAKNHCNTVLQCDNFDVNFKNLTDNAVDNWPKIEHTHYFEGASNDFLRKTIDINTPYPMDNRTGHLVNPNMTQLWWSYPSCNSNEFFTKQNEKGEKWIVSWL